MNWHRLQIRAMKDAGLTVRRKGLQLFQFKYYKEQQALNLSDSEMAIVIDAVVNPPKGDYETRLIASKILIKVPLDLVVVLRPCACACNPTTTDLVCIGGH
jgi:hypothetical protein